MPGSIISAKTDSERFHSDICSPNGVAFEAIHIFKHCAFVSNGRWTIKLFESPANSQFLLLFSTYGVHLKDQLSRLSRNKVLTDGITSWISEIGNTT